MKKDKYEVIWREKDSKKVLESRIFNTKEELYNFYKNDVCLGIQYELIVKHNNKEYNLFDLI